MSGIILTHGSPASLLAIDPSSEFLEFARLNLPDSCIIFHVGDAANIPPLPHAMDLAVSGLALNIVLQPVLALQGLSRTLSSGGMLAFYVWDYGGRMDMLRYFWDSAVALDPHASSFDEGIRFPMCKPDAFKQLCIESGLNNIEVTGIESAMIFSDFHDFWSPFLGGQGPAPSYVAQLDATGRKALEEHILASLPFREDGSLSLAARAWAVRATP